MHIDNKEGGQEVEAVSPDYEATIHLPSGKDDETRLAILRGSLPQPDGWRPIETPPEHWVDVLLYDPNYPNDHRKVLEGYFDGADGWVSADREPVSPTHWRPLPSPPAGRKNDL